MADLPFVPTDWLESLSGGEVDEKLVQEEEKLKTEEEIERYTLDEDITELDRAILFLSKGYPIQRASLLRRLPSLIRDLIGEAVEDVCDELAKNVKSFDGELQTLAAQGISQAMEGGLLTETHVKLLVPLLASVLSQTWSDGDDDPTEEWLLCLDLALPILKRNSDSLQILQLALKKGRISESAESRAVCARMLGTLAKCYDSETIRTTFLSKAVELCQDTECEVRMVMSQQLTKIMKGLGLDLAKSEVFPELLELMEDEEIEVKIEAFQCLVELLSFFDAETLKEKVVPIFVQIVHRTPHDMLRVVANKFGEIFFTIGVDKMSEADSQVFLDFFCDLANRPESESRQLCAFNFPGVLMTLGAHKYGPQLHTVYETLSNDGEAEVRLSVAGGLHEVAKLLGSDKSWKYLKDILLDLLRDSDDDVKDKIMKNLNSTLHVFEQPPPEATNAFVQPLIEGILSFPSNANTYSWRQMELFFDQIGSLPSFVPPEAIQEFLMPRLFDAIHKQSHPIPVKSAAAKAVIRLARRYRKKSRRDEVFKRILRDMAHGKSYWDRMLFADTCCHVMDHWSFHFFKSTLFDAALDVTQDSVPNVRLKMCSILHKMKRTLKLPEDAHALGKLNNSAALLMADDDRDVALAAKLAGSVLSKIEVGSGGNKKSTPSGNDKRPSEEQLRQEEDDVEDDVKPKKKVDKKNMNPDVTMAQIANKTKSLSDRLVAKGGEKFRPSLNLDDKSKSTSKLRMGSTSGSSSARGSTKAPSPKTKTSLTSPKTVTARRSSTTKLPTKK